MKRQAMGWTVLTLAILGAALVVAYAAPGGDAAKAPAAGCQMAAGAGADACPCKCGCAEGKACACGKDCPCKCGCAEGKPCACGAGGCKMMQGAGCKMAGGACPMMQGGMRGAAAPEMAPVKVNAESEKLWKQLGAAMAARHEKMWELFALKGADKPDEKAIGAKMAEIAGIDQQMSVARGGLYQYRVQGASASAPMGGGMGRGRMMGNGAAAGGCGGGCGAAK